MVLLQDGEKEVTLSYDELLERFDVKGLVRVPAAEFGDVGERRSIGHFNLGTTNHEPGIRYLFIKMLRIGSYGTKEQLPLLSLEDARVMRCMAVENKLSPDSLTPNYFEHSLASITDIASLRRMLVQRYGASISGLTEASIDDRGVAFTLFEAVE